MPVSLPAMPLILLATCLSLLLASCSSPDKARGPATAEDVWQRGKTAFDDNDVVEAQAQFDIIKLQYPASQYADDAQYYLAEINFKRGEFILAAFNYSLVRRSYPSSEFAKTSAFKAAECYNQIAPPMDRDQEYTKKAIQAYSEFQSIYPQDSLALVSLERIADLRGRLAERYLSIAQQYDALIAPKSSLIYYDAVIDEYPDTKQYEVALAGKLDILLRQKKYDEARTVIALWHKSVRAPMKNERLDAYERQLNNR